MLKALYHRTLAAAAHRHARRWLALVAFVESSVFPVPPDVMLVPMVLAERNRWLGHALVCTLASVAGGCAGYLIGFAFLETIGQPVLEFYSYGGRFDEFAARYAAWGAWIVFAAGITPFPYKVITIASGVVGLDPVVFVVASLLSRGLRFFALAGLLWWFGPAIRGLLERYFGLAMILVLAALVGGFLLAGAVL